MPLSYREDTLGPTFEVIFLFLILSQERTSFFIVVKVQEIKLSTQSTHREFKNSTQILVRSRLLRNYQTTNHIPTKERDLITN